MTGRPDNVYAKKARQEAVRCPGCGDVRIVSQRNARAARTGESSGLCRDCLWPVEVHVTEALRQWWRDRFTPAQLHVLAAGLLPFDVTTSERELEEAA